MKSKMHLSKQAKRYYNNEGTGNRTNCLVVEEGRLLEDGSRLS